MSISNTIRTPAGRHVKIMANTYLQIYLHFVFAVKGRVNLIPDIHKEELYKYITGIVTKKKQKLLALW